ncbi:MAG TPA: PQQ-dependent sugar dehydrogenase [Tepidisphaeraceae bacterium]|jgi:glucose/arabinose dehydrogenase
MKGRLHLAVLGLVLSPAALLAQSNPIPQKIPTGPGVVKLQTVANGFAAPVWMTNAPGDNSRLFVVDQAGQVKIVQNGAVLANPFINIVPTGDFVTLRTNYDERGLLGLAFDPNFNNSTSAGYRRVFTYESDVVKANPDYGLTTAGTVDHQDALVSYRVDANNPNQVDATSRQVVMRIDHPSFNHDGGHIAFGPDGYLYLGIGDGGGANDTGNGHNPTIGNARDVNSPLGKMLRLDVYGNNGKNSNYGIPASNPFASGGGVKEIFASGFRNPYRFSFDGNRLLVADVGQNNIEEIDDVVLGGNYGWNAKEGTFKFNPSNGTVSSDLSGLPPGLIDPLVQYDHDEGIAIVGGFVYHGTKLSFLQGKYVFGDFSTSFNSPLGRLFYADLQTGSIREFLLEGNLPLNQFVKGIGQGPDNELYLMTSTTLGPTGTTGTLYAMVPEPASLSLAAVGVMLSGLRRKRRN